MISPRSPSPRYRSPVTRRNRNRRRRSSSRSRSRSRSRSASRSRTPEKRGPQTHYLYESDNEYEEKEEILNNANVGDILLYSPNNQMGAYTAVIKLDSNGEKYFQTISSYDDYLAGNLKRKNTRKNKKKRRSRRR